MKLAVAVDYDADTTTVAAVAFDDWDAREPTKSWTSRLPSAPKPQRGEPDLRAVAAIVQLLREHSLAPEVVVLQLAVHLDSADTPGIGRHLYEALGGAVAVIGVTRVIPGMPSQFEVYREDEAPAVTVTCAGIDLGAAKGRIRTMHGKRRVPTLLKLTTRMAKAAGS